jgi:hypothetical protein
MQFSVLPPYAVFLCNEHRRTPVKTSELEATFVDVWDQRLADKRRSGKVDTVIAAAQYRNRPI